MLPQARLLARAFHRVPVAIPTAQTLPTVRRLSCGTPLQKKSPPGSPDSEHATKEKDAHNVQSDAVREGKQERASGEGSSAATEKADGGKAQGEDGNKKAERDNPEAPKPVIGMNDERGGKGR